MKPMRIKDFDLGLLRRPDYGALKHGELDSDSESDDDMDVDTSNDDECGSEDIPGQSSTVVDVMDVDEDVGVNVFGQPSEKACIEGRAVLSGVVDLPSDLTPFGNATPCPPSFNILTGSKHRGSHRTASGLNCT
ncbi:hypothetical protein B0H13DRAFT_1907949 [Mycena leptocephala]|jgi:hypothetical protein|nr:hypothetical protein B0H13DRAFT_1907949 [Mycena leptocephala]